MYLSFIWHAGSPRFLSNLEPVVMLHGNSEDRQYFQADVLCFVQKVHILSMSNINQVVVTWNTLECPEEFQMWNLGPHNIYKNLHLYAFINLRSHYSAAGLDADLLVFPGRRPMCIHLDQILIHIFVRKIHGKGEGCCEWIRLFQCLHLLPKIWSPSGRRQGESVWALSSESPGHQSWWHNLWAVTLVKTFKFLEA